MDFQRLAFAVHWMASLLMMNWMICCKADLKASADFDDGIGDLHGVVDTKIVTILDSDYSESS